MKKIIPTVQVKTLPVPGTLDKETYLLLHLISKPCLSDPDPEGPALSGSPGSGSAVAIRIRMILAN
jgi:hypothetical protein